MTNNGTKRGRKGGTQQNNSERLSLNSDWVKTIIAIIVQSVAVGFYMAGLKSDLVHLTDDVKERKILVDSEFTEVRLSLQGVADLKAKMANMADDNHRSAVQIEGFEKEITGMNQRLFDIKDSIKDSDRNIDALKAAAIPQLMELQKRLDDLRYPKGSKDR